MQTKNINHQHDPQGLVHQNCQLSNSTESETLSSDRMYGSTGALYQRSEMTNVSPLKNGRDQLVEQTVRSTSSIPKLLSPLGSAHNNSSFGSPASNTAPDLSSGQTISCRSTPLLSTGILRRQTSLGQLEGRTSASSSRGINGRHSDRPFGSFQQKIRAMLLSSKDSTKTKDTSMKVSHVLSDNQSSNQNQCSQNSDNSERTDVSHNLTNNYSTIRSSNSQTFEMDNSLDEENDSFYIRDVCSKWFGQKQSAVNQSFSSQMVSAVNKSSFSSNSPKLSHNMKSSLSEKVVKKDSICQNSYTFSAYNGITPVNGCPTTLNQNILDDRHQTSVDYNPSVGHDIHVVVVSGLESDINRSTALTVRSEISSNEISIENNSMPTCLPTCAFATVTPYSPNQKVSEICETNETVSSPDHNYKSSSDSGRGTIRSSAVQKEFKNNSSDGISPLDLTSLDSDQSTHGVSQECWHNQNRTIEPNIEKVTKNETIEKMQRELQRILEDNTTSQSIEEEVQDLSQRFKTRLSIVNESDSWTSNTPSQTPQPQQKPTSVKYCEPKGDSKYSSSIGSKGLTTSCKALNSIKSKQGCLPNESPLNLYNKSKSVSEKQRYLQQRCPKTTQVSNTSSKRKGGSDRSAFASNKSKLRTRTKSKERFIHPIDCDIASTTTGRDTNYDDLSSEYTANTSLCERDNTFVIRKQLQGLENMYSEIIEMLGSRRRGESHKTRRKVCRSTSSVVSGRSSVTSRGTRDMYYRRSKQELRHKYDESHSSRRIKRLETHVITLARSVAQLSTDMRSNQSLSQEMDNLRQDVDLIRNQLLALKQSISLNGFTQSSKAYHQSNGHISANGRKNQNHIISPNKVEKLKRFFGDEPPLLRQFLKKLGYEKYARNFESEKIGITELPYLTEERMQKLGIPLGPRMRIMQESHHQHKTVSHSNTDNYSIYAIV